MEEAAPAPAFAVCGWSGSGKTTLLERVIPRLVARGLAVAVVKHDAHGVSLDRSGKDSDRLFRAGADVCLRGPGEVAWRRRPAPATELTAVVAALARDHDLVLVEGHKATPLPKVWLAHPEDAALPPGVGQVVARLPWG
ncbi:MAG: molybdopterin-guanine dinucleotide biosynthesis protein B, partial [Nitrospirae bacterium]